MAENRSICEGIILAVQYVWRTNKVIKLFLHNDYTGSEISCLNKMKKSQSFHKQLKNMSLLSKESNLWPLLTSPFHLAVMANVYKDYVNAPWVTWQRLSLECELLGLHIFYTIHNEMGWSVPVSMPFLPKQIFKLSFTHFMRLEYLFKRKSATTRDWSNCYKPIH